AGVPVLGVALRSGSPQEVGVYMQRQQLHFDNVNDERGVLSQQWQVQVTPTVALVKNGRLIHSTSGVSSYWGLRSRIWLADQWH
ncbi:MAG TPA: protein disulfide oxidoreductase, partial [Neisseria sp.]|nr:protein disulfide oxidoreductase [Neisseria sp.]